MPKDTERTYNGSYLYRLNQELSGQEELAPYFVTDRDSTDTMEAAVPHQETGNVADGEAKTDHALAAVQHEELT